MTSIRQSFVFSYETTFGGGKGTDMSWLSPPPGSYFDSTAARQTTTLYTTGSKFWDTVAYGAFAGTWNWTFTLDYEYLEPLALIFDTINDKKVGDTGWASGTSAGTNIYQYTFKKVNTKRVPSFCVRRKILNVMAGGPAGSDELDELYGCVVQNASFARSASSSQYQVTLSGFYVDEKMVKGTLSATDYAEHSGKLVEYACMLVGGTTEADATLVANTESVSVSIDNNASAVYNTCSAFAKNYYEGNTSFKISTSCYSTNPAYYKQRVYSGGYDNTTLRPKAKGLAPLDKMFIISYNGDTYSSTTAEKVKFAISKAVFKSMKWQNGEGSKLVDSLSSVECADITLTVTNSNSSLLQHSVNSTDITPSTATTFTIAAADKPEGYSGLSTFSLVTPYAAPVLRQFSCTKDTAITTAQINEFEALTDGYIAIQNTTTPSVIPYLVRPLQTVADITLTNAVSTTAKGKITISGTPSAVGRGYYLIVNAVTGECGTLRIIVNDSA